MRIDLIPGSILYKSQVRPLNLDQKENINADALSWSTHTAKAPPQEEDEYAEFFKVDELVIRFGEGVHEIQHIQRSMEEILEEQAEDEVCSEVIKFPH